MRAPSGPSPISAKRQSGCVLRDGAIGAASGDSITAVCVECTGVATMAGLLSFRRPSHERARPGQHNAMDRFGSLAPPGDETQATELTLY